MCKLYQVFMCLRETTTLYHIYRKGKTRPISIMSGHEKFVNAFMTLGDLSLTNEIINIIEEFTCHLYGYIKQTNIHEVIKINFENKTKPEASHLHKEY